MILKFSFDLLCITEVWGFAACPCQLNWANTSIFTTTSFSTVDFHAPSDPKLPLKPNTSTAATHWMCDKEDAARPAPSAFGSVTHQERKKKKGSGTEELERKREWTCSEVVCLLSSRAQTDWAFTVWPKTLFIQNVLRKELREAREAKEGEC